jgi:NAD+ diphosphatase
MVEISLTTRGGGSEGVPASPFCAAGQRSRASEDDLCLIRGAMGFVHLHAPHATPGPDDFCLVIQGDRLLSCTDTAGAVTLPVHAEVQAWGLVAPAPMQLGVIERRPCWSVAVPVAETEPPPGWLWHDTRTLLGMLTPAQLHAVNCARQLHWWDARHRFCGACGTPTVVGDEERVRRCPACNALYFPVASPAVIVAVTRGDDLLLAHNRNFRPGLFSLLAGFVDPGENLEQAAAREVREEVGLTIGDFSYVGSQSWPFPNSLMIGLRARHIAGEIVADGKEIEQAGWFHRSKLPDVPRPGTIARRLIDAWLDE